MLLLAFWGSRKIHGSRWPVGPTSSKKQKKPNWRSLLSYHTISHIISYHIISYHIISYITSYHIIVYYIILYYIILHHCYLILQYIPSSPSTSWGQNTPGRRPFSQWHSSYWKLDKSPWIHVVFRGFGVVVWTPGAPSYVGFAPANSLIYLP